MVFFLPRLKQQGFLDRLHITICNVGSRKLADRDDYGSKGWEYFAPNLTIYGFDADADACEAANADLESRQVNWSEHHIPLALSHEVGESTLYVTHHPMCSSLYMPDEPFLSRFQGLIELSGLDFTVELETTTLEQFCQQAGIETIDFLQIDVQGADLDVLKGAAQLVEKTILGIQIEVEFSPLYVDQPLFADVDAYLRARDFTLFDLSTRYRVRARSPIASPDHPGQLLWGDAYYLCDLLQPTPMTHAKTPEQIFKLACIADVMDFPDYSLELLEYLTINYGNDPAYNFANLIVESFRTVPELVEQGIDTLAVVENLRDYFVQ